MTKTFFSKNEADKMARKLRAWRYSVEVWMDRDGFGQQIYIVKWN